METKGPARQKEVQIFLLFILLSSLVRGQDRIDMKCNPSFHHRYDVCPKGYCCVRDEFFPTYVYCRRIGQVDENCTTKESESECPCDADLNCKANIMGHFPSLYGRCKPTANSTSTPETTATTANTTETDTTLTTTYASVSNVTVDTNTTELINTTMSYNVTYPS